MKIYERSCESRPDGHWGDMAKEWVCSQWNLITILKYCAKKVASNHAVYLQLKKCREDSYREQTVGFAIAIIIVLLLL